MIYRTKTKRIVFNECSGCGSNDLRILDSNTMPNIDPDYPYGASGWITCKKCGNQSHKHMIEGCVKETLAKIWNSENPPKPELLKKLKKREAHWLDHVEKIRRNIQRVENALAREKILRRKKILRAAGL